jgi:hypothetical protein
VDNLVHFGRPTMSAHVNRFAVAANFQLLQ